MKTIILLILLVSCGKPEKECMSQEEAILRCQAEEIAGIYFPTEDQLEFALNSCQRMYSLDSCY